MPAVTGTVTVAVVPGGEGTSGKERQVWPGSSSGIGVVRSGVKSDWDWGSVLEPRVGS